MGNRKTAIYCRVSTDDQAEHGYSLRDQERSIRKYISLYEDEFIDEIEIYIDDGFSAKNLERRDIQILLKDIKNGIVSKVVVHNLDRLTRSIMDLMFLIEYFEKYDVKLYSLKEKIDTDTAIGRFFVSVIVLISQWEREAISERTIRGMDQSSLEGNYVRGMPPFGYELIDKKLVINDKKAAIVKQIYTMYYFEENSINQIYHYHASNHNDFNFIWTYDRVRRVLNNEIYTGLFKNKRLEIHDHSPAIISKKLFKETQEMLKIKNRYNSLGFIFGRKCYNSKTKENLVLDSTKKPNKTYYYYYDRKENIRINEGLLDLQIGKWMNIYFKERVNEVIVKKISAINRQNLEIKFVEELMMIGAITKEYYLSAINKLSNVAKNRIYDIEELRNNIQYWEDLTRNEKIKSIKYSVDRIEINLSTKSIEEVFFKVE